MSTWKNESLKHVLLTLESGGRPKGGAKTKGIPSVGGEHLNSNGKFNFKKMKFVPENYFISMNRGIIKKEDVLIVKDGATTGKTSFVEQDFPYDKAAVNEHVFIARPNEEVYSKYLFYYLFSLEGQLQLKKAITGSAQGGINLSILDKIKVRYPESLKEQNLIVQEIEKHLTRLDEAIKNLKSVKEKLRVYRKAVLKAAFDGDWVYVEISDLSDTINNGYTPKSNKMYRGKGEIPFLKVYNLTFTGELDFSKKPTFIDKKTHLKDLTRSITLPGDVLINIVGPPLGKVSIVPSIFPQWNINQAIVLFRPNNKISSKFLSYYLQNPKTIQWYIKSSNTTAGQHNVKVSTCRKMSFPNISIDEQNRVVQKIESRFSIIDKVEEVVEQSLDKAGTLRKSILKCAFEGKLVKYNGD